MSVWAALIWIACGGPVAEPVLEPSPSPRPPMTAALGGFCGGIAGIVCEGNAWCDPEPGDCGRVSDGGGTCVDSELMCTQQYEPVCGCDARTYGNDCDRRVQRAALDYAGACNHSRDE